MPSSALYFQQVFASSQRDPHQGKIHLVWAVWENARILPDAVDEKTATEEERVVYRDDEGAGLVTAWENIKEWLGGSQVSG